MSVFEPLEDKRKKLLTEKMVVIQRIWRGYVARKRFRQLKAAAILVQKHFRGSRQRMKFLRKRRAAILIQSHLRGMFARELVAAIRKKKAEEEAERRRLRQLEEERLAREEERLAKERAEKNMEESYRIAQMELLTLAKIAEHKSQKAVTKSGDVDLDQMFKFLSEDPKPVGKEEINFLADVTKDLEELFKEAQKDSPRTKPRKPVRRAPAPPPPPGSRRTAETPDSEDKMSRTQRRQRRVMKKLLGVEDEGKREEHFDPDAYPMIKFAEMYFNDFPKDTGGFSTLSLRRAPRVKDPISKGEMLVYTKSSSLPTSMVHMHDPENVNLACSIFKDMCKLLRGDMKPEQHHLTIQSTIAYGIDRPELRDEIFCQLIRQVSSNPKEEAVVRGWHFITLCITAFPPSKNFKKVSA